MSSENLKNLLGIKECIRYYPPNIRRIQNSEIVFQQDQKKNFLNGQEINLFVPIPFCKTPCGFCPFNRYFYRENKVRSYISSIEKEIQILQKLFDLNQLKIKAIEIGGGTPSDLDEEALEKILKLIHKNFNLDFLKEFTIEVKPILNSFTKSKIKLFHKYKVNRISLGVQSTNPKYLQLLGRSYTPSDAFEMIKRIQQNNFTLNIDMMYRLPGETLEEVAEDVDRVRFLGIDHISWFPFIPFRGTSLRAKIERKEVPKLPENELYFEMFKLILKKMNQSRYQQYTPYYFSISEKKRCQYHINRWKMPQLKTLGIGAGAFSFFNGWIYTNANNLTRYREMVNNHKPPIIMGKKLNPIEKITRLAVLGIKFFTINVDEFQKYSGAKMNVLYQKELKILEELGLIRIHKNQIECTLAGKAFNNDIAIYFSADSAKGVNQPQGIYLKNKGL